MNVTLTSLEALILKATHESLPQPDAAAIEAFCAVLRDAVDGPQLAVQSLAVRIHSLNGREALLALMMLDKCMRRCNSTFHAEVGKFRFLNEMIKLVSPKYFADRTAPEVRTRVIQLLHAWSLEYPKETKFKVAFEMLKNQGVIKETPPPLPPEEASQAAKPRPKNAIFEDEEKSKMLQKLLQSKKPEDLQHANRLIKTMVREEERRTEANCRRAQELGAALDSAGLLRDMLEHADNASPDEEQLIHELYSNCARLRPVLQQLAATEGPDENLSEIFHANDVFDEVFEKYRKFASDMKKLKGPKRVIQLLNNDSLLDFAGANDTRSEGDEPKNKSNNTVIDDLGDIFSNDGASNNETDVLKPVNLMTDGDGSLLGEKNKKVEGWHELDSLGEQLLKQSLPENAKRLDNFNRKNTKKIPMNALEKSSPKHEVQIPNNGTLLDLDFFTKKPTNLNVSPLAHSSNSITPNDDVMVDISSDGKMTTFNIVYKKDSLQTECSLDNILDLGSSEDDKKIVTPVENKDTISEQKEETKNKISDVKPLTDINLTLQSVHPSKIPPMTVFEEEEGLTVIFHFCKDTPRPDVRVIVVSTTSKNSSPIEDYKFQAFVPKGYKVRLLTPSGTSLPAYNPFLPPPALTQLLLLASPGAPPPLRFVLSYTLAGDSCSDMGDVPALPPLSD